MDRSSRGIDRRSFVRSAVAIGGASALAACIEREEADPGDAPRPTGDPDDRPERQHAWNDAVETDDHGNDVLPEHHVMLELEYVGDALDGGADADALEAEREQVEDAFTTLERAYERSNDGLLFTAGYAPAYFDRFDEGLAPSVDLPRPEALAPIEAPALDDYDALVHLASDHGQVAMSAEEALTGGLDELNGIEVPASLEGVLSRSTRRTGFIGEGIAAEEQTDARGIPDSDPVPEDSPLFMGFKSGFKKNQASEDRVTIPEGPFADGTTTHLSRIQLSLHQWYEQDSREQRVGKMFCPVHADEGRVEGAGHNLGDESGLDDCADDDVVEDDARTRGLVGHSQKAARAREDDEPRILRRDVNSTDDGDAGVHFLAHQRAIADFVDTREAMTGTDLARNAAVGQRTNNGILQYMSVEQRGNYLVPPRRHRSLPRPRPE